MDQPTYVPLHCHSYFSLLDGLNSPEDIVSRAQELKFPAIALTDHGTCAGLYRLYKACQEAKIKPILGMEAYFVEDMHARNKDETRYHLTLWAKNKVGYHNLIKLSSLSYLRGFYSKQRIDMNVLRQHHEGLMAGSACPQGILVRPIRDGNLDLARRRAMEFKELFKDDFYIEVMLHRFDSEKQKEQEDFKKAMRAAYDLGTELGIQAIWTGDSHYCREDDAKTQDILVSISTRNTLKNKNRMSFHSDDFYIKPPAEVLKKAWGFEPLVANTLKVAAKVEDDVIQEAKDMLPLYPIPEGYHDENDYLLRLLQDGMKKRKLDGKPEYCERLEEEIKVIQATGYSRYFLILWDLVNYAKRENIRVGCGRGSGVASLALYCLGVTSIDPIRHKLMFSRFLSVDRINPPDVDIDFDHDYQEKIFRYLGKYGTENVVRIGTYSTLKAKEAIRTVAKVLDIGGDFEAMGGEMKGHWKSGKKTLDITSEMSKLMSEDPNATVESELEDSDELKRYARKYPDVFHFAKKMQGTVRSAGIHPSGIIIIKEPIINYVPLRIDKDGIVVTQYDMTEVEKLGLLKFDILALNTLTMVEKCLTLVKQRRNISYDINTLEPNDAEVFKMLRDGKTEGVFQFESPGMTKLLGNMGVDRFEDMVASVAIYRPGPLKAKVDQDYCDYKHGRKEVEYIHPIMKEVLSDTFGLMVYQENIIKIVQKMAGYTAGRADKLRKSVGKKIPEIMEQEKAPFIEGCMKNGVSRQIAEHVFEKIAFFAGYGFNLAHATAYSMLAYQTAWLKLYFPSEFFCALISTKKLDKDRLAYEIAATSKWGISFLPYHIDKSKMSYTIEDNGIRRPLTSLRGIGDKAAEEIVSHQPYHGIFDFLKRTSSMCVNSNVMEVLVSSGCMEHWGISRDKLMTEYVKVRDSLRKGRERDKILGESEGSLFDVPV